MQSKKHSFIEALINVGIGYGVAVVSQIVIYPFFGILVTVAQQLHIAIWFTVVSLMRSYGVRRLFNWWHHIR